MGFKMRRNIGDRRMLALLTLGIIVVALIGTCAGLLLRDVI